MLRFITAIAIAACMALADDPTPEQIDAAWDSLHPVSQRYIEQVAAFYSVDDADRLWYRKVYIEDENKLSRLSRSAREARIGARESENAPAWYCLDSGNTWNASNDEFIMAWADFHLELIRERSESLTLAGYDDYIFFVIDHEVDHQQYLGHLIAIDGGLQEAVIKNPPNAREFKADSFIVLPYPLARRGTTTISYWKGDRLFQYDAPSYEPVAGIKISPEISTSDVRDWEPDGLSPKMLAWHVRDKALGSLPEWRSRRIKNPEYTKWQRSNNNRSTIHLQTYGVSSQPPEYIYEWTKIEKNIRLGDD